jgi:hypothetical protein
MSYLNERPEYGPTTPDLDGLTAMQSRYDDDMRDSRDRDRQEAREDYLNGTIHHEDNDEAPLWSDKCDEDPRPTRRSSSESYD